MSYDLIKTSIKNAIKHIEIKTYMNYFKSSLIKTKDDIKQIKMKYRKIPKIYKE
jgi:flagellar biosynthesis component FlhA